MFEFFNGAILVAMAIAFGFTGWRAVHQGHFQAVSESYYGRKAQGLGGICLLAAIIAAVFFVQRLLGILVFGLRGPDLFYILGAGLGAWLTLRYYLKVF